MLGRTARDRGSEGNAGEEDTEDAEEVEDEDENEERDARTLVPEKNEKVQSTIDFGSDEHIRGHTLSHRLLRPGIPPCLIRL